MSRFVVMWSDSSLFTEKQMKVFESRDLANWFAKDMETRYNNVEVYSARKGDFDD